MFFLRFVLSRHYTVLSFFFTSSMLCTFFFFLNDPAPPEIYPLSLHDALPISYRSTFLSPKPETARNATKVEGLAAHKASKVVSCNTRNAASPESRAAFRRHSRKYSLSCASDVDKLAPAVRCSPITRCSTGPLLAFALRPRDRVSATSSHSGVPAHISHVPQRSHFGCSPKCLHTWCCRHSIDCTNRSTS